MSISTIVEYIWIDGGKPTPHIRSKTKILSCHNERVNLDSIPKWSFDGSSTNQAEGADSDCILVPVCMVSDPVRDTSAGAKLVLCEVFKPDGTPHPTNIRAKLRAALDRIDCERKPWIAFEQEYTLFEGARPLGFPAERRFPVAQGPYYCGVGADEVFGRPLAEDHLSACLAANLHITGINAEVMPGQWEFQCGGPGADPLIASDHLWIARWLLYRLGEKHGVSATLDPKPVPGDWNGAGMHANFSTAAMRAEGGEDVIEQACKVLEKRHALHLLAYGAGNEGRLTGAHETCSFREFRYGVADRTASIRIPRLVSETGRGYLEDRRPAANADPYKVSTVMIEAMLHF